MIGQFKNAYRSLKLRIIFIVIILISGCGPKVYIAPNIGSKLRTIALLPPRYTNAITREKIDYIHNAFERRLSAKGYNVISGNLLNNYCSQRTCNDHAELFLKSQADAIAEITVESTNNTNLLAVYSSSITGSAVFYDKLNSEIARIRHTQSDRGGLLLNSGQVLQGIESTVSVFENTAFPQLAEKFVDSIVSNLPQPQGANTDNPIIYGKSSLTALGGGRYMACIEASNIQTANLKRQDLVLPLRHSEHNKFCGSFLLDIEDLSQTQSANWTVNLFGNNGERKSIKFEPITEVSCSLEGQGTFQGAFKLENNKVNMTYSKLPCNNLYFLVYESKQTSGPFQLVGKLNRPGSSLTLKENNGIVAVFAVSDRFGNSKALFLK